VRAKKKAQKMRKKDNEEWMEIIGYVPSAAEKQELRVRGIMLSICFVKYANMYLYVHKESLEDPSVPMIKANKYLLVGQEGSNVEPDSILLVDSLIFDGEITPPLGSLLAEAGTLSMQSCRSSLKKRLCLLDELHDIHTLLFSEDMDRLESFRVVRHVIYVPSAQKTYFNLHWSIHQEL
jgi:hypothetical protein